MAKKPNIIVSSVDLDRLELLLASLPRVAAGKGELQAELDRADVVEPQDMPPDVVTMNSLIRFRVESSAEEFCKTLVYPKDVKPGGGTLSILAPLGSALLGLSAGSEIEWPGPAGERLQVRIVEIVNQPERSGDFHR